MTRRISKREKSLYRDRPSTTGRASDKGQHELLSTKLTIPLPRSPLVTRERLLARLEEGLAHKLTLLSAPAGFGKSTLVAEWIQGIRDQGSGIRNQGRT